MTTVRWFRRSLLVCRCIFLYVPALVIAVPLSILLLVLFLVLFLIVGLPLLILWSHLRHRKVAHERASVAEESEQDLENLGRRALEAEGQATLEQGDRLLAQFKQSDLTDQEILSSIIHLFRQVRNKATREGLPLLRVAALYRLGSAWYLARKCPGNEYDRCLKKAIRALKQCLIITEGNAWIMRELGVYCYATRGSQRERNLERALAYFESASKTFGWIVPSEQALTQHWLGATLLYRAGGSRQQNLERAINCFSQVRDPHLSEAVVRDTQSLLDKAVNELWGSAASIATEGNDSETQDPFQDLDLPATSTELPHRKKWWNEGIRGALRYVVPGVCAILTGVYFTALFPQSFATVVVLAAGAGSVASLLLFPKAAESFEALLLSGLPIYFKMNLELISVVLFRHNERLQDIFISVVGSLISPHDAIVEIRKGLGELDPQRFPLFRLILAQILSRLLCAFPVGEAGEGVEEAILVLRSCEVVLRRPTYRLLQIFHHEALARAYLRRLHGNAVQNAEEAVRILTGEVLPLLEYLPGFITWLGRKRTLLLLAQGYRRCSGVDRRENLERALSCYREAHRRRVPFLRQLSDALVERVFGRLFRDEQDSISRSFALLSVWPRLADAAILVGMTDVLTELDRECDQSSLSERGTLLREAYAGLSSAENLLEYSIGASLLHVRRQKIEVLLRLARIFHLRRQDPARVAPGSVESLYRRAARQAMREGLTEIVVDALIGLGQLFHDEDKHRQAVDCLAAVVSAMDRMRWQVFSIGRRAELLRHNAEAFDRLIDASFSAGDFFGALELSERSRSRTLIDLLDLKGVLPRRAPSDQLERFKQLLLQSRLLEERLRVAEKNAMAGPETLRLSDQLHKSRQDFQELLPAIHQSDPDFFPATEPLGSREIRELAEKTNSIFLLFRITDWGTCCFLVFPDGLLEAIRIRSFTRRSLDRLLLRLEDEKPAGGWFGCYRSFLEKRTVESRREWFHAMDQTLAQISTQLLATVYEKLREWKGDQGQARLVVVPNRGLAVLPLHACSWPVGGVRRYLLDDFLVSYAPNLSVFARCQERESTRSRADSLFAVGNPNEDANLLYSEWECDEIAALRDAELSVVRFGRDVTREEIFRMSGRYSCIHFSCHADYQPDSPFNSRLELSGGEVLNLGEILDSLNLPNAWLVTLSACETGLLDHLDLADEHYGLSTAFLCAGASTVWSTFWAVSDLSSALLMVRAYEALVREARSKCDALRSAQIWLRDLTVTELIKALSRWETRSKRAATVLRPLRLSFEEGARSAHRPFAHPYYWAGFESVGA